MADEFVREELVSLRALNAELRATLALTRQANGAAIGGVGGFAYTAPTAGGRTTVRAASVKQGGQNLIGAAFFGQAIANGDIQGAAFAGAGMLRGNKKYIRTLGRVASVSAGALGGLLQGGEVYADIMKGDFKSAASQSLNTIVTGAFLAGPTGAVAAATGLAVSGSYERLRPSDGKRFFTDLIHGNFSGAFSQLGGQERDRDAQTFRDVQETLLALKNEIGYLPEETRGLRASTVKKFKEYFAGEEGKKRSAEIVSDVQEINRQVSLGNTMDAAILEAKLSKKIGAGLSKDLMPPVSTGERWYRSEIARRAARNWSAMDTWGDSRAAPRQEYD